MMTGKDSACMVQGIKDKMRVAYDADKNQQTLKSNQREIWKKKWTRCTCHDVLYDQLGVAIRTTCFSWKSLINRHLLWLTIHCAWRAEDHLLETHFVYICMQQHYELDFVNLHLSCFLQHFTEVLSIIQLWSNCPEDIHCRVGMAREWSNRSCALKTSENCREGLSNVTRVLRSEP